MKKLYVLLAIAGIFLFSCKSGGKKEVLTDPQIDATIGVVRDHVQYVAGFAVSPDGKKVVSTRAYDYIFWDADQGKELKAIRHEKYDKKMSNMSSVKYTPDGKLVVLAGYYTITIIDAEQMNELKTITFDNFHGQVFDISKDSKYLVIADGNTLKVIDLSTYEVVKTFGETENDYSSIAFLDSTQFLATEYDSEDMYLWDVNEGKDVQAFTVPSKSKLLTVSNDGKYIGIYDSETEKTIVLNSENSDEKYIQTGYANNITFMDDNLVVLQNSKIKVFNIESGEEIKSFGGGGYGLYYDPNNKLLYYKDKGIIALKAEDGTVVKSFGADAQGIAGVLPSPTGRFLVFQTGHKSYVGGYNLFCLPVDTSADVNLFGTASKDFGAADFVGKSDKLAAVVSGGDVDIYDLNTGKAVKQYSSVVSNPIVITPDGKKIIAKDYNNSYNYAIFNLDNMAKVADLTSSSAYVQYADVTPDGKYYVLSDNNGVFIYDLQENKKVEPQQELKNTKWAGLLKDKYVAIRQESFDMSIVELTGAGQIVSFDDVAAQRVAVSPDKKYMAIAPRDHFAIYLYDFTADDWKPVLYGHSYFPTNVAFTPDSKYLISTSDDNQAIIWDVATGKRILTIVIYDLGDGSKATKDYIVYAPNGRYDGTEAAIERFLYFEKDGKRMPASLYKDKCYTPDLLGRTLGQDFVIDEEK